MKNRFWRFFSVFLWCLIFNCTASGSVKHKANDNVDRSAKSNSKKQKFDNSILAVVNGDVITKLDVVNKMKLFMRLARLEIPEGERKAIFDNMLLSMVDELLKLQKVTEFIKRYNDNKALVSLDELDAYLTQVLKNAKIARQDFEKFLETNNIPMSFVYKQIDANLSWNRFIVECFSGNIQISDAEVASHLNQLTVGQRYKTYILGRIIVPFTKDNEEEARKKIDEALYYLNQGVAFELIANNFSSGAEAQNGGFIGPVSENQLKDNELSVLGNVQIGRFSSVIRGDNEFLLYKVYNIKKQGENYITRITAQRVEFSVPREQMEEVAAEVLQNASDADKFLLAASLDKRARISKDETFVVEEMRPEVQGFMSGLTVGTISAPVPTQGGFMVFYTKNKEQLSDKIPSFEEIRGMIHTRKLESISKKQFQEVKANAYIKYAE